MTLGLQIMWQTQFVNKKIINLFIITVLFLNVLFLNACSDKKEKKSLDSHSNKLVVDLKSGTLGLNNQFTFQSLNNGQSYNVYDERKHNIKLDKNGKSNEFIVDVNLNKRIEYIESILSQELGFSPTYTRIHFWGYKVIFWNSDISLQAFGAANNTHVGVLFNLPSKQVEFIPKLSANNTLSYVETLFSGSILNKEEFNHGTFVELTINSNGTGVILSFEVDIKKSNNPSYVLKKNDLLLKSIKIDLSRYY